jgi:hypothetical protein
MMRELNAAEAEETKETGTKVSVESKCAGELSGQVFLLKRGFPSAAQAALPPNPDRFVSGLIIRRQHDVSQTRPYIRRTKAQWPGSAYLAV